MSFEVPTQDKAEFLDNWKKLETNLKLAGSLVDAESYLKIASQKKELTLIKLFN
ncbi:hypothetical protein [Okeania sp.]|uniref:hypothetical protein n=1 Tax=Okeania sp. TaxID=3100323 RepID=UPI002B4AEE04|nr:hypothetical protein [Okeania sp.]MEB3339496.1 hypothetical protein [Okeania sp.]